MPPTRPVLLLAIAALAASGCAAEIDPGAPDHIDRPLACVAAAEAPAAAPADLARPDAPLAGGAAPTDQLARPRGLWVPVEVDPNRTHATGATTVVYLHRGGITLTGGYDDAARNVSSVVAGSGLTRATIPPATFSDPQWASLLACVKDEFARFNVQIVDQRPAGAGYHMAVFGGTGAEVGFGGVGGVAPIDPNGCSVIDGAVTFIFSGNFGNDPIDNCEVATQEIAHAFSLDHELLPSDPMTYLGYNGHRTFQDMAAPCGEYQKRACICGRPSQNSVQVLLAKLGPAAMPPPPPRDTTRPTVSIVSPAAGARLPAGSIAITARATDDAGPPRVTLVYQDGGGSFTSGCGDNVVPCARAGGDFVFTVPNARGSATFHVEATDAAGNVATTPNRTIALVAGGEPPPGPAAGTITIAVDMDTALFPTGRVVAPRATITSSKGAITAASIAWTDPSGATTTYPLCPDGGHRYGVTVQVSRLAGLRSFVIHAADEAGAKATTPPTKFSVDD